MIYLYYTIAATAWVLLGLLGSGIIWGLELNRWLDNASQAHKEDDEAHLRAAQQISLQFSTLRGDPLAKFLFLVLVLLGPMTLCLMAPVARFVLCRRTAFRVKIPRWR